MTDKYILPSDLDVIARIGFPETAGRVKQTIASQREEIERLSKDAARYRWLRDGNDSKYGDAVFIARNLFGLEWDEAIDAAISGAEG